ncbi:MAG: hypothetical protein ACPL25_10380 [Ignavibacteria bacterium]
MVKNLNKELINFQPKHLTDFLALSILIYFKNFKLVFRQILIPQFISAVIVYILYISLYGEFNLTYFLSNEGKIFLVALLIIFIFNLFNSIYQSIKIVIFNNLELRNFNFKFLILLLTVTRLSLLITMITSFYFENSFLLIALTFIILNTLFYQFIFNEAEKIFTGFQLKRKAIESLKLNLRAFLLGLCSRFLIIIIPIFATFSIFIVYEFVKILITGKTFFFVIDSLVELQIWILCSIILFLIANPFQYFTMMIYHKYFYLKEIFLHKTN